MLKTEIRKSVRKVLQNSADKLPDLSKTICNKIIASEEYQSADIVLAYMALPDEVDLKAVILDSIKCSKKVYIPRIVPNTILIDFFEFKMEGETAEGSFGILEPNENQPKFEIKPTNKKILVLTPGRAFTKQGDRLGRGKAFYDTFLTKLKAVCSDNLCVAGVCFECQIMDELPVENHDIQMDVMYF